jgi:hypothetical protein
MQKRRNANQRFVFGGYIVTAADRLQNSVCHPGCPQ